MAIIAIFNQKGGVGKTTTSFNLAAAMRQDGVNPLMIDLDPQNHLTTLTGVPSQIGTSIYSYFKGDQYLTDLIQTLPDGMHVIPSHIELCKIDMLFGKEPEVAEKMRVSFRNEMLAVPDMPIIIDCSPLLGVLSVNAILAAERVLVPVSADFLSYQGAVQLQSTLEGLEAMLKRPIKRRYLITRYNARRRMAKDMLDTIHMTFGQDVCHTRIHESSVLAEGLAYGKDIFRHAPDNQAARDYRKLYEELVETGFLPLGD